MNTLNKHRKLMLSVSAAAILLLSTLVSAGDWQAYDKAALEVANKEGKTVVLDFHADWCPTCRKQQSVLEKILKEKEFANVRGFTVDYDRASDLKKEYRVQKQSTLIVLKNGKEVARSMGLTNKAEIQDFIRKGR